MRRRLTRHPLLAGAIATALAVAGCAAEPPVSPLPIEAAGTATPPAFPPSTTATPAPSTPSPGAAVPPATSAPASPARRPATAPAPTRTATPKPTRTTASPPDLPSSCLGAVTYTVDASDSADMSTIDSLCLGPGAVLRIQHIGPGLVETDPADDEVVDQHYEAGVVDVRFLRAGTVVVTIPADAGEPYEITVVVR